MPPTEINLSKQASGNQTLGMSNLGNTAGTTGVVSSVLNELLLAGGSNVTLSQSISLNSATITINAGTGAALTLMSAASITGNTSGVITLISSGTLTLVGGNNITLSQSGNAVTISGANQSVQTQNLFDLSMDSAPGGATSGTMSLISSGTGFLFAGNNITLSQSLQSFTISGPTVPAATNFSLNGSSSSVSLVAGAGISITGAGSTITISNSAPGTAQTVQSLSITATGNTTGATSSDIIGQSQTISGAGIVSVGFSGSSLIISATAAAAEFSLNASSSSVSLIPGAGIGFSSSASSITVSLSSTFMSAAEISADAGATSGASGAITSGSLILCAGSNITLSQTTGTSINSVTIIGPTIPAATNFLFERLIEQCLARCWAGYFVCFKCFDDNDFQQRTRNGSNGTANLVERLIHRWRRIQRRDGDDFSINDFAHRRKRNHALSEFRECHHDKREHDGGSDKLFAQWKFKFRLARSRRWNFAIEFREYDYDFHDWQLGERLWHLVHHSGRRDIGDDDCCVWANLARSRLQYHAFILGGRDHSHWPGIAGSHKFQPQRFVKFRVIGRWNGNRFLIKRQHNHDFEHGQRCQ